jgi:2-methylisocitrate lyase-like PEP mutase family enzyme
LTGKRKARGWRDEKSHELGTDLEEVVQRLVLYDGAGGENVFPEALPWE